MLASINSGSTVHYHYTYTRSAQDLGVERYGYILSTMPREYFRYFRECNMRTVYRRQSLVDC